MTYFAEDPTFPAGLLLLIAVGLLVATRVTQQGKYLVYALVAAAAAVGVFALEWFWVTDNERIEQVVYGLRDAVAASDADAVMGYMAPDVMYVKGDLALEAEATEALIRNNLDHVHFDIVRISNLQTNAGQQSRRGTARFGVLFKGTVDISSTATNFGSTNSIWELGLRETQPGTWKVNRITPVQLSGDGLSAPGSRGSGGIPGRPGFGRGNDDDRRGYRP